MSRTEHDMLRDLHAAKIKMNNGKLEAKQWVMTPLGVGLLVGIALLHPQLNQPYARPMNVVVGGKSLSFRFDEVRACNFFDFAPDGRFQRVVIFIDTTSPLRGA